MMYEQTNIFNSSSFLSLASRTNGFLPPDVLGIGANPEGGLTTGAFVRDNIGSDPPREGESIWGVVGEVEAGPAVEAPALDARRDVSPAG